MSKHTVTSDPMARQPAYIESPLFAPPPAPAAAVAPIAAPLPTSHEVSQRDAAWWRHEILVDISRHPEAILPEICQRLGRLPNQISGRISELRAAGLIEFTKKRPHPASGAACMAYSITSRGREELNLNSANTSTKETPHGT